MKYRQLINAIPTLQKIIELKLPVKKAYLIYTLAKEINGKQEFFINEERKLIEKYNGKIESNGQILFNNNVDQQQFQKEYEELNNLDIEINNNVSIPVVLKFDDLKEQELSAAQLASLEDIVNFEE